MPITNPTEYARLSKTISRAKKSGKDISQLLTQRQSLISVEAPKNRTPKKLKTKSRTEINRNYYQKNKEFLQEQAIINKEKRQEREEEKHEEDIKELAAKFYGANSIKVLMSFKEYIALKKGQNGLTYFYDCQNQQAQSQEKIIEIAKYHEERGKIKYHEEAKSEEREEVMSDCGNCYEYKKVSVDSEAVRKSVAKLRNKQGISKKSVIPEIVKPKNRMPAEKISNQTINEILAKIKQLSEQQKIFYQQLINSQ
ncbi:19138_t:CDS:2, partial [Racocetra fulgida]